MKIFRYSLLTLIVLAVTSCDLELQDDPNSIKTEQINPTLILNSIQTDFAGFFNAASTFGMQMTRIQNPGGADYPNTNRPTAFDGLWTNAYANILNDIYTLKPIAEAQGLTRHLAIAQTIEAYVLLTLVDYFGDVPYSESFAGLANPNPIADDMEDVYDQAIALLNNARLNFNKASNPSGAVAFDFYYGGTATSWVRLVNTLKLKAFLNLRLLDPSAAQDSITAVLNHSGGLIESQSQNFVFRYATSTADPDSRHPRWTNNWLTGANDYIANYLMWQMNFGYNMQDPRMRFYFYRQTTANNTNPNNIRCILEQVPAHYPNLGPVAGPGGFPPAIDQNATNAAWGRTFCFPTGGGYWGRDHVDPQGIPPDGLLRTTWGSYPVGARFDANNGLGVTNASTITNSMRGAGIQPIMMRSFVNFMLAEADLYMTLPGVFEGAARTQFENGMRNSMADVRDWAVVGTYGSNGFGPAPTQSSTIAQFYPTAGSVLASVRVATTANLTALSGNLTIDGVVLADGDRVLVKNQSTASQNGIYIVAAGAWARSSDADAGAELVGATVTVNEGTINGAATTTRQWAQTTPATIVVGTSSIAWAQTFNGDVDRYISNALTLTAPGPASNALGYDPMTTTGGIEGAMNLVAREYWVALFGNGIEAYNLYRRTGYPGGMQPAISPNPGDFPRSFWYPVVYEARNANATQKLNQTGKVFWDTNTSNLNY
jgi:Starch-binding associating with outer membrane/Susd and RagB outer membrane lipoprotein